MNALRATIGKPTRASTRLNLKAPSLATVVPPSPSTAADSPYASRAEILAAALILEEKRDRINAKLLNYKKHLLKRRDAARQRKANVEAARARDIAKNAVLKRDILECELKIRNTEAALKKELGKEKFDMFMRSRGSEKKKKPTLPASMNGVCGSTIKDYIAHPQLRKKRGVAGRVGGERDVVPESAEI